MGMKVDRSAPSIPTALLGFVIVTRVSNWAPGRTSVGPAVPHPSIQRLEGPMVASMSAQPICALKDGVARVRRMPNARTRQTARLQVAAPQWVSLGEVVGIIHLSRLLSLSRRRRTPQTRRHHHHHHHHDQAFTKGESGAALNDMKWFRRMAITTHVKPIAMGAALLALGLTLTSSLQASPVVIPNVVQIYAHDTSAFTQGLLLRGSDLFESTGLFAESSLRQVDLETGTVLRTLPLAEAEFGEGLALVDDRLIQLTWRNGVAHDYAAETFEERARFAYEGEGWGLCYDGRRLIMSNGTENLFFRDPETFELLGSVTVRDEGSAIPNLNELECVSGEVFANVWPTNWIFHIDSATGEVLTRIDVRALAAEQPPDSDILNGIAFDSRSGHFFLTGKFWTQLVEVEFQGLVHPDQKAATSCSLSPRSTGSSYGTPGGALAFCLAAFACWRRSAPERRASRARAVRQACHHAEQLVDPSNPAWLQEPAD